LYTNRNVSLPTANKGEQHFYAVRWKKTKCTGQSPETAKSPCLAALHRQQHPCFRICARVHSIIPQGKKECLL